VPPYSETAIHKQPKLKHNIIVEFRIAA